MDCKRRNNLDPQDMQPLQRAQLNLPRPALFRCGLLVNAYQDLEDGVAAYCMIWPQREGEEVSMMFIFISTLVVAIVSTTL